MKGRTGKIISYLPEIIILLLCAFLLLWQIGNKKGYHMDEILSFEFANAEFNPWIVPTQPQGRLAKFMEQEIRGESAGETVSNLIATVKDVAANRGGSKLLSYKADVYEEPVWIDRETFIEYVTVNDKDAFNYLSVYFNIKGDVHPPLYYMVLHTASSIFREKLTPMTGCLVNLLCVLGVMIFLMKLGRQCMQIAGCADRGRFVGNAAALLYGLSVGALSTVLLIRMYAMLTFFCVALLSAHVDKIYRDLFKADGFERKNKALILVTMLGFWTQYFFLFYAISLAAVTAMILWREKRIKELWCYVRAMLTAAVIGVALFPLAVLDVISSDRGVEALGNLMTGLSGYGTRLWSFLQILAKSTGAGCLIILPIFGLIGVVLRSSGTENKTRETGEKSRMGKAWLMLLIPVSAYFLLAARMSPYLIDRYIMPVFPIVVLILALLCLGKTGVRLPKKICAVAVVISAVMQVCCGTGWLSNHYLFKRYAAQEEIARTYRELPCICVYDAVGYYENLPEFTWYEKSLLVTLPELSERKDVESISALDQVVVILKKKENAQAVREILTACGLTRETTLLDTEEWEEDEILLFAR